MYNLDKIYDIAYDALHSEYEYGVNDCNIVVLKVLDTLSGSDWVSVANYSSLKEGFEQLKELGFDSVADIVIPECDEVIFPIEGDIGIDSENPFVMGVVTSGMFLGVNTLHDQFELMNIPMNFKYYRIKRK